MQKKKPYKTGRVSKGTWVFKQQILSKNSFPVYKTLCVWISEFIIFRVYSVSWMCRFMFVINSGIFSAIISCNIFLCHSLFFILSNTNCGFLNGVSYFSEAPFNFHHSSLCTLSNFYCCILKDNKLFLLSTQIYCQDLLVNLPFQLLHFQSQNWT